MLTDVHYFGIDLLEKYWKNTPENSGVLIQGSTKNSDLCTPIPFVKNKLRNMLLDFQRGGDPNLWDPSNFCKY